MTRTALNTPATRAEAIAAGRRARSEAAHEAIRALKASLRELFAGHAFGHRAH
ncbi:MAG: hypothetical protein AAFQ36_06215 [Pseudomonadota bacterium]